MQGVDSSQNELRRFRHESKKKIKLDMWHWYLHAPQTIWNKLQLGEARPLSVETIQWQSSSLMTLSAPRFKTPGQIKGRNAPKFLSVLEITTYGGSLYVAQMKGLPS